MSWPQQPPPQQPRQQPAGSQRPGQQSGWGNPVRYPGAVQAPAQQPPPKLGGRPPGGTRRRRRLIVVLVVIGVLVVGGLVAAIVVAATGMRHESSGGELATSTDIPGAGSGSAAPAIATITRNAETVVHGLGNARPAEFCPLIDHADLSRLLREKHLAKCADIKLTAQSNRSEYQSFTVSDPSAIQINGDTADIPATAITPTTFGTVEMREDGDGTWKFRFFTG